MLRTQVDVMVVVDTPLLVDAAECAVKVGNATLGFQMKLYPPLAVREVGFRGIGSAVPVVRLDVVELTYEVVPQPFPVDDDEVFSLNSVPAKRENRLRCTVGRNVADG